MNATRLVSDMSFSESPVLSTCLYARKSLAFDALSPAMQRMLEGMTEEESALLLDFLNRHSSARNSRPASAGARVCWRCGTTARPNISRSMTIPAIAA